MAYRETFRPLKITAYFRTGVACDRWLPLDGIVLYQATRDRYGQRHASLPGGDAGVSDSASTPLKLVGYGTPDWYYACSWAQPQPWWMAEGQDYWNKRFDQSYSSLVDFGEKRGKVIIEQGKYKAYHMPLFYYAAQKVEWYCIGDKKWLEQLLSTCTHIGKKTVQGWGRVLRWEVEPWPEDWSEWRDGRLTRGLPFPAAMEKGPVNLAYYGLRPPYYQKANQRALAVPE